MSVRDVVRRDIRESGRTRIGVVAILVLVGVVAGPAAEILLWPLVEGESLFVLLFEVLRRGFYPGSTELVTGHSALVLSLGTGLTWALPFMALLLSYNAVLGERKQGTIKFLLGLPNSRFAVLVGKIAARSTIVVLPIVFLVAPLGLVVSPSSGGALVTYLGVLGYAVLLAVCFITIGVAISTVTTGSRRAIFLALGVYIVLRVVWRALQLSYLVYTSGDLIPQGPLPEWFYLTGRLNPVYAAEAGIASLVDTPDLFGSPFVAYAPPGSITAADWLPVAVIVGWSVLVFGGAYWRFRRIDVGSL